ncbi:MAG: hypothetical protein COW65_13880 [Cytophagales bacterium CG18_big_fil_WC_8_21_14_2_50_42_9]|nr:MAG: hypothetical protein COW65_13880 [Cytophagales bacterium CG18_big_fil_WC_8_21_14_2_50_42_9]
MNSQFPLEFTLDNGSHVVVNKTGTHTYDFTIHADHGAAHQFTYVDEGKSKTEVEEPLSFVEIDALRRFWLETEDIL